MSTYYFLLCDDHKEYTDAASRTAGGYCHLGNSDTTLLPFIISHSGCHIRIISEHDRDFELLCGDNRKPNDIPYLEWSVDNIDDLLIKYGLEDA